MLYGIGRGLSLLFAVLSLASGRVHAQAVISLICEDPTPAEGPAEIAVMADLSGGTSLGAINARIMWNPAQLNYVSIADGEYGQLAVNTSRSASGQISFNAFKVEGQSGEFSLAVLRFDPLAGVVGTARVEISVDELVAAQTFEDLLPQATTVSCAFLLGGLEPIAIAFDGPAEVGTGERFAVTITAAVPQDAALGALSAVLEWDPARLRFLSVAEGAYAALTSNTRTADSGQVRFNAFNASGMSGPFSLGIVSFEALGTVGNAAALNLQLEELAAAQTFQDLLPRLQVGSYRVGFVQAGVGLRGDFNRDRVVDFLDFFLFADHFQLTSRSPDWDPLYDLAPNGQIDFSDFFSFADVFGSKAP